jgi:diaminopimelate epimerase
MTIKFYKYQGTGNDFVLIDNRNKFFKNNTKLVKHLCDRKFGIGADGLILLEHSEDLEDDFKMVYFNADGKESSMCGNGGRCIVRFAEFLGIITEEATFTAIDGKHLARVEKEKINLKMQDVSEVNTNGNDYFLDTGSPHHIVFKENISALNVKEEGAAIRNNETYKKVGVNVNFVEKERDYFKVRTFERGVEDETLSCGTGVTAVAIAAEKAGKTNGNLVKVKTPGGDLEISFQKKNENYVEVWLSGPAKMVFEGTISC